MKGRVAPSDGRKSHGGERDAVRRNQDILHRDRQTRRLLRVNIEKYFIKLLIDRYSNRPIVLISKDRFK